MAVAFPVEEYEKAAAANAEKILAAVQETAERLGISARTLRYKLAQMRDAGLDVEQELLAGC